LPLKKQQDIALRNDYRLNVKQNVLGIKKFSTRKVKGILARDAKAPRAISFSTVCYFSSHEFGI
jgi:hypothetical protein